jgi:DNA-binding CsgD family transcriptional regulator
MVKKRWGRDFLSGGVSRAQRGPATMIQSCTQDRHGVLSNSHISGNNSSEVNTDRLDRLTDKQRECLRLVYAHMSSKEIAQQLGVEPGTVDQYVKGAIRILGVSDRRAAARMLAEHEGGAAVPGAVILQDEQAPFDATPMRREPLLPLPLEGLRPTYVSWTKRLVWIVTIAIGVALAFLILIASAEALTRLIQS